MPMEKLYGEVQCKKIENSWGIMINSTENPGKSTSNGIMGDTFFDFLLFFSGKAQ